MKATFTLLFVLALPLGAVEEPRKLKEGDQLEQLLEFKKVTVLTVEWDGVRIRHEGGIKKIPIEDLPEAEQKRFGLGMEGVEEYRNWQAQNRAREELRRSLAKQLQKQAFTIEGEILQVVAGEGILLRDAVKKNARLVEKKLPYNVYHQPHPLAKDRSMRREKRYKIVKEYQDEYLSELVFVQTPTESLVEATEFSSRVCPNGTYSYLNVLKTTMTIGKYSADLKAVLQEREMETLSRQ